MWCIFVTIILPKIRQLSEADLKSDYLLKMSLFVCVYMFQVHIAEATMENYVTQISREDLDDLREAFNKIGPFPPSRTHT